MENTKEFTHKTVGNSYPMEIKEMVKNKKGARKWQR